MPNSDPEARKTISASSNDAATSVITFISAPVAVSLSQFQSRKTKQRKQYRQDQKPKDNLRLFPAQHFKVMMQWRHLKETPARAACALCHFEDAHLQHHR